MDEASSTVGRASRLQDINALLLSGACHFLVLIALGLWTVASRENWRGVELAVHLGDSEPSAMIDDSPLEATVEFQTPGNLADALGPEEIFDTVATSTSDFAALEALSVHASEMSGISGMPQEDLEQVAGSRAVASTEFFGIGGYAQFVVAMSSFGVASTEFFGIGGYGQSFVYVVDCSGSMSEHGKFDRARYELLQSIEQLSRDQRYFVIFFNDSAQPMDANEMVLATDDALFRTAKWINHVEARGGTVPLPALLYALSLRPDAIYFLSDGLFDPLTVSQLRMRNRPNRRLNARRIPIHTIALFDRSAERQMRTIARDSQGEYRFVP